jgi:hypothetical protein
MTSLFTADSGYGGDEEQRDEINALRLTNTIEHITVSPAYHLFKSLGGESWKAHTKS